MMNICDKICRTSINIQRNFPGNKYRIINLAVKVEGNKGIQFDSSM